jgi:hypothetical protein
VVSVGNGFAVSLGRGCAVSAGTESGFGMVSCRPCICSSTLRLSESVIEPGLLLRVSPLAVTGSLASGRVFLTPDPSLDRPLLSVTPD